MSQETLSIEVLQRLFKYDPGTGVVTRLASFGSQTGAPDIKVGKAVGTLKPSGYLMVSINRRDYRLHRVIWCMMTGEWPGAQIDHLNNIPTDNRWCNLRLATQAENCRNQKISKNNTTGVKGVSWRKSKGKYEASIMVNRKTIKLGYFHSLDAARVAREAATKKYHGQFARMV